MMLLGGGDGGEDLSAHSSTQISSLLALYPRMKEDASLSMSLV